VKQMRYHGCPSNRIVGTSVRREPATTRAKSILSKIPLGLQRYGLAVSSVAVALGISRFLFHYKIEGIEFPIFLIAVTLTVWYAAVGAAIVALVLATLDFSLSDHSAGCQTPSPTEPDSPLSLVNFSPADPSSKRFTPDC
jgi:hypothetical protein